MKYFIFTLPILLNAQVYMAKIEPFASFSIEAQTSGQIVTLDINDEMRVVDKTLIKLDDSLDKKTLSLYKEQLKFQEKKLEISTDNYNKFIKISGKSQNEKDTKFINLLDIKNNISNLKISIEKLKDTISKKSIYIKNLYIKEFFVRQNNFVTQGAKLATAYDINKAKLVVYVNSQDYENIKNKQILINGKKDKASFYKIDLTPDETYISAYKIELLYDGKEFGKSVKVEFVK